MKVGLGRASEDNPREVRVFTRDFALVCLVTFDTFLGHQMLTTSLPIYATTLGAQPMDVGLIQGLFAIAALTARIFSGRAIDTWGRKMPLTAGAVLVLLAMLAYSWATRMPTILALRVLHGVGFGVSTTAASTIAADLVPARRRGEAMGFVGFATSIALAIGPGAAIWLISPLGLPLEGFFLLFAACTAVAVPTLLFALLVHEPVQPPTEQPPMAEKPVRAGLFCRDALPMSITLYFAGIAWGAVISYVPIYMTTYSLQAAIVYFFFIYAVCTSIFRPFVGGLSDRLDRRLLVMPFMLLAAVAVGILGLPPSMPLALISALLLAVGFGPLNPVLMALMVDVVKPRERGAAMATFMAAMDLGVASGASLLGPVAQVAGYGSVFPVASGAVMVGLVYFYLYQRGWRRKNSASKTASLAD